MKSIRSFLLFLLANTIAAYLAPNPPGKYNVTLTTGPLVDWTRNDPYAPTPTPRTLMVSVFQPAKCEFTVPVPDMPNKTAEYQGPFLQKAFNITANLSPLFLDARLPVCPIHPDTHCSTLEDAPVLLFSPGLSIPRLYYNVLVSAIASEGFTVISIDHPEDANIIVYPNGNAIYYNSSILDTPTEDLPTRAADASFVIDQLSNATAMAQLLPQRGPRPFPTDRVAMFGHSLGGATSIVAAHQDPRICAAVNWDGSLIGNPSLAGGVSQPVLFLTHDETFGDDTWIKAWPHLKGPKIDVRIANTTHETFCDVPTLLQAAGESAAPFVGLLGTIAPAQMVRILTAYTTNWMNGAFRDGKEGGPLYEDKASGRFPQISILKKGNF